ncbi:MAG: transposase [Bacteroidales bacterium]|nr:transposase [Bacteroidales bacterium]
MSKKRRRFSNELKFTIVLEAIKGQRQISEIATEYNVHPNQITTWKKQFLSNGAEVFGAKSDDNAQELENTQEELFKKIGQQQYEIDWLKKNLNRLESWRKEK